MDLFLLAYEPDEAVPGLARWAEKTGFDALWVAESNHHRFVALTLAAAGTKRVLLGTDVAAAFARSPMVTAYAAWDLQRLARGRFILGLSSQVPAHNRRRFGVPWEHPGRRMREVVLGLRAIWDCWQNGSPLDFRGRFYTFTLMLLCSTFNPGPSPYPPHPVFLGAVNPYMLRLAGELAQGLHVHPLNSRAYLEQVVMLAVTQGLRRSGRGRAELQVTVGVFVAADDGAVREVRRQVGFYGSTPAYRTIFAVHGWEGPADELRSCAAQSRWDELERLVPDEVLTTLAVVGRPEEVGRLIRERYLGLADRVAAIYGLPRPPEDAQFWAGLLESLHSG